MDRRQQIRVAAYEMIAADTVILFLLILLVHSKPAYLALAAAGYLLLVLISNFLFLRRKLRLAGPSNVKRSSEGHSGRFSLYAASVVFFLGTLYGGLMILHGDLPMVILPALIIPLVLAIYMLKTARKTGTHKPG
jgi:hypothetical protein